MIVIVVPGGPLVGSSCAMTGPDAAGAGVSAAGRAHASTRARLTKGIRIPDTSIAIPVLSRKARLPGREAARRLRCFVAESDGSADVAESDHAPARFDTDGPGGEILGSSLRFR
jgi:hypothetical protein